MSTPYLFTSASAEPVAGAQMCIAQEEELEGGGILERSQVEGTEQGLQVGL
jgi:hypothetical protein